jgi:hypothetical protein
MDESPPTLASWTLLLVLTLWIAIMTVDWTERSSTFPHHATTHHAEIRPLKQVNSTYTLQPASIKTANRLRETHTR